MRANWILVVMIGTALCGCSKKETITGQLFVSDDSGATIRLSGIRIVSGRQSVITNRIEALRAEINRTKENRAAEIKQKQEEVRKLNTYILEEQTKIDTARDQVKKKEKWRDIYEREIQNSAVAMRSMNEHDRLAEAEGNRKRKKSIENLDREITSFRTVAERASVEIRETDSKVGQLNREIQALDAQQNNNEIIARLAKEDFKGDGFPETITDADGKFALPLDLKDHPTLVACAHRTLAAQYTEFYLWAVPVTQTNMILAKGNAYVVLTTTDVEFERNLKELSNSLEAFGKAFQLE